MSISTKRWNLYLEIVVVKEIIGRRLSIRPPDRHHRPGCAAHASGRMLYR
jgi:hypothetical protein